MVFAVQVSLCVLLGLWVASVAGALDSEGVQSVEELGSSYEDEFEACQCGVFMTKQTGIKTRRSRPKGPPEGDPVVTYDNEEPSLPCGNIGNKNCVNKCLDVILKYLPKAGPVICGAVERDVYREKAYLYIKNCESEWTPTNFSAGKDFCCSDGEHVQC